MEAAAGITTLSIYLKCIEQKLLAERSFYSMVARLCFFSFGFLFLHIDVLHLVTAREE